MNKIIIPCLFFISLMPRNSHAVDRLLSVSKFYKILNLEKNVILIDIRTSEEYQSGHIKNAVNIEWLNNFEDYIQELDTNKTILFYCKSGELNTEALKLFIYKGFKNTYVLQAGLAAWKNTNHTIVSSKRPVNKGISIEIGRAHV